MRPRVEQLAERLDHPPLLPVGGLPVLGWERDHGAAVVAVGERDAAVDLDRTPLHQETASISAGRCGSNASRQQVQVCASRTSASQAG